ncbi:hypothetical protein M758_UG078900 [Ceratodon purpureus]|nr:hypothetical protein M758_UG078900 [Ceratodon purpureus]
MVLCDLEGFDTKCNMDDDNVTIAHGPKERACGIEGEQGYGWWKRQYCFSPKTPVVFQENVEEYPGSPLVAPNAAGTIVEEGSGSRGVPRDGPGRTKIVEENVQQGPAVD